MTNSFSGSVKTTHLSKVAVNVKIVYVNGLPKVVLFFSRYSGSPPQRKLTGIHSSTHMLLL